jgi:hypothetical protein
MSAVRLYNSAPLRLCVENLGFPSPLPLGCGSPALGDPWSNANRLANHSEMGQVVELLSGMAGNGGQAGRWPYVFQPTL